MSHMFKVINWLCSVQKVPRVVRPDEVYSAGVSCLLPQALVLVSTVWKRLFCIQSVFSTTKYNKAGNHSLETQTFRTEEKKTNLLWFVLVYFSRNSAFTHEISFCKSKIMLQKLWLSKESTGSYTPCCGHEGLCSQLTELFLQEVASNINIRIIYTDLINNKKSKYSIIPYLETSLCRGSWSYCFSENLPWQ